jgi:hypothetical protein
MVWLGVDPRNRRSCVHALAVGGIDDQESLPYDIWQGYPSIAEEQSQPRCRLCACVIIPNDDCFWGWVTPCGKRKFSGPAHECGRNNQQIDIQPDSHLGGSIDGIHSRNALSPSLEVVDKNHQTSIPIDFTARCTTAFPGMENENKRGRPRNDPIVANTI